MKVHIPFPCNVSPDKFTKVEGGKHCSACDKVVIDFTKMTTEEIQDYFVQKAGEDICGTYRKEDIEDLEYAIPLEVVQSNQRNARNVMMICFLVAFGFMSFDLQAQVNNEVDGGKVDMPEHIVIDTPKSCTKIDTTQKVNYELIGKVIPIKYNPIDTNKINTIKGDIYIPEKRPIIDTL